MPRTGASTAPTPTHPPTSGHLLPLGGYPWYLRLDETRGRQDIITLPLGATERRPMVVAVHGGGDRPEWACSIWRIAVESYSFVVCPMGLSTGASTYAWGTGRDIAAAVERALSQTNRQFPDYVRPGPMIYAGFSQGANLAGEYLIGNAERFPVVVLAEGGYDYLTDGKFGSRFYSAGGRRLFLLCGTPGCMVTAKRALPSLKRAGLDVMVAGDMTAGHGIGKSMQQLVRDHWQQLVAGLAAWETFSAHRWPKE